MTEERTIPHDLNAERAALGCCLLDKAAMYAVLERLLPEDFFHPPHLIMYQTIARIHERGVGVDMVTLTNALMTEGRLEDAGGPDYIAGLTNVVPTDRNARHYAEIVLEQARLRTLCKLAVRMQDGATSADRESGVVLDDAMSDLIAISRRTLNGRATRNIYESVVEADEVARQLASGGRAGPLRFGFRTLDNIVSMLPGDLFVLGGRQSHGKTAMAVSMCLGICRNEGRVLYITTEMDRVQMAHRFIAAIADIPIDLMRRGVVSGLANKPEVQALMALRNAIRIVFAPALTKSDTVRMVKQELLDGQELDLVVIDYLQRMRCAGRPQDRRIGIGDIANSLKDLGGELGIRILLLSQLARPIGPDRTKNKPPTIWDLKEAGEIEDVADTIGLLHRLDNDKAMPEWAVDLLVEKNRNGPLGDVRLILIRRTASFHEATGPPRVRNTV